ncbi:MAG: hypothetical protein AAGB51_12880 [Planctomycetota bacterium]
MAVLLKREPADTRPGQPEEEALVNNRGWGMLVHLAYERGWRPAGTEPPRHWDVLGGDAGWQRTVGPVSIIEGPNGPVMWPKADYASGRGQLVTEPDAKAMAAALQSVIDDLPEHDPLDGKADADLRAPVFPHLRMSKGRIVTNAPEAFGGPNKPTYKTLVDFMSRGAFRIW